MTAIRTIPRPHSGRSWHTSGQTKTCDHCGSTYRRPANQSSHDWGRPRYCGLSCSSRAHHASRHDNPTHNATTTRAARLTPTPPPLNQTWRVQAQCRDRDDVEFVPDTKAASHPALAVCRSGCPALADCLAYGLATRSWGVWGGQWLDPARHHKTA